jgi:hypothetical protein
MSEAALVVVVADPPHGEVSLPSVAAALAVPPEDIRPKLDFQAPEILAATDRPRAMEVAEALNTAGASVVASDGLDLARIPWPSLVASLALGPDSLAVRAGGVTVDVPFGAILLGVHCAPPADFVPPWVTSTATQERPEGPAAAEVLEWVEHLDLYVGLEGGLRRFSVAPELTDFSGVIPAGDDSSSAVEALVTVLGRRCTSLPMDDRLVGVRPRRRFLAGEAGFNPDQRRRYAFGTLLLRHTLESIAPELRDVTQYELGSRLAYVLSR